MHEIRTPPPPLSCSCPAQNVAETQFHRVHEGDLTSGVRSGNKAVPPTVSPPVTSEKKNPLVPDAFEELDTASGGGGGGRGGGEGVRGSDSGKNAVTIVDASAGAGAGASVVAGGTREQGWNAKLQAPSQPLPLGRDKPLQIFVMPATMNGGGVPGFTNHNDDFVGWRGEDGHLLPKSEVDFFPCSLTEEEEYPTMGNPTLQYHHSPNQVSSLCLISCSQPSSDKDMELYKAGGGEAGGG